MSEADLLYGAEAIADFVFGTTGDRRLNRRKIYTMIESGRGLPIFHMGGSVCARRSTILKWYEAQEVAALAEPPREPSDADKIPDAIRCAREAAGQSMGDAARMFGMSRRHWVRYESGEQVPSLTTLEKIARAFGKHLVVRIE